MEQSNTFLQQNYLTMGSKQSTHTASEIKELQVEREAPPCSVSGRKQSNEDRILEDVNVISTPNKVNVIEASDDEESESEYMTESDEEGDGTLFTVC